MLGASFETLHRRHDGNWREVLPRLGISAAILDGTIIRAPVVEAKTASDLTIKGGEGRGFAVKAAKARSLAMPLPYSCTQGALRTPLTRSD